MKNNEEQISRIKKAFAKNLQRPSESEFPNRKEYLFARIEWEARQKHYSFGEDDADFLRKFSGLNGLDLLLDLYSEFPAGFSIGSAQQGYVFNSFFSAEKLSKAYMPIVRLQPVMDVFWPVVSHVSKADVGVVLKGDEPGSLWVASADMDDWKRMAHGLDVFLGFLCSLAENEEPLPEDPFQIPI